MMIATLKGVLEQRSLKEGVFMWLKPKKKNKEEYKKSAGIDFASYVKEI